MPKTDREKLAEAKKMLADGRVSIATGFDMTPGGARIHYAPDVVEARELDAKNSAVLRAMPVADRCAVLVEIFDFACREFAVLVQETQKPKQKRGAYSRRRR